MGIVRVVHCAGEVKRGWRTAANLSEAGLLGKMWLREVPVKWRAEGRLFQVEETAAAKVQRCVDGSIWERKGQYGKRCWKTLPQERGNSGAEMVFRIQKTCRFYGAIKLVQELEGKLLEIIAGCLFPGNSKSSPTHTHTAQSCSLGWLAHSQSWSFFVIPAIGIGVPRARAQRTCTVCLTASERFSHICFTTNEMPHVPVKPLDWLIMSESRYQKLIIYSNWVIAENN